MGCQCTVLVNARTHVDYCAYCRYWCDILATANTAKNTIIIIINNQFSETLYNLTAATMLYFIYCSLYNCNL